MFITVIGESHTTKESYRTAEKVGELVAKAGAILICGGKEGVMEAAAKGAKRKKGLTVGILPGSTREEANKHIDIPIVTGLGYARNKIVVKSGQVIIAVGGGYGTLSEIGFALGYGIPVIGINTWQLVRKGRIEPSIIYTNGPEEAVSLAVQLIKKGKGDRSRIEGLWRKHIKSIEHRKRMKFLKEMVKKNAKKIRRYFEKQ